MANELYTRKELAVMTPDALDELRQYYADKGNREGLQMVLDELNARWDDDQTQMEAEAAYEQELAWEAENERQQMLHDEMINDKLAEDGRWG